VFRLGRNSSVTALRNEATAGSLEVCTHLIEAGATRLLLQRQGCRSAQHGRHCTCPATCSDRAAQAAPPPLTLRPRGLAAPPRSIWPPGSIVGCFRAPRRGPGRRQPRGPGSSFPPRAIVRTKIANMNLDESADETGADADDNTALHLSASTGSLK
jgi:hypothetical protein